MKFLSVLFTLAICAVMVQANNEVNELPCDSTNGSVKGLNRASQLLLESDEASTDTLIGEKSKKVEITHEQNQLKPHLDSSEDITITEVVGEVLQNLVEKVSAPLNESEYSEFKEDTLKEEALIPKFKALDATGGSTILEPSTQELESSLESGQEPKQESDTKHNTEPAQESTLEHQDPSCLILAQLPTPDPKTSQIPLYKRIFKFLNRYIGLFSTLTASVVVLGVCCRLLQQLRHNFQFA